MTGWIGPVALSGATVAVAAFVTALLVARRYRELHAALTAAGVLSGGQPRRPAPVGSSLPAAGTAVPADLLGVATDGSVLTSEDLAGPDVVMVFLAASCPPCRAALPELRAALAAMPSDGPRPVAVLRGPVEGCAEYAAALAPVARVIEDGDTKFTGVTMALAVYSYPAVLVVGDGVVRRAGMTVRDVALATT
jgi:Redoxin